MACKLFANNGSISGTVGLDTFVWEVPEDICKILLVMEGGNDTVRSIYNTGSGTVQAIFDVIPGEKFKLVGLEEGGGAPTQNSRFTYYCARGSGGMAFLPESDPLSPELVWAAVGGSGGIQVPFDRAQNKYAAVYDPGGDGGGSTGGSSAQSSFNNGGIGGSQVQGGQWNGSAFKGGSYYNVRSDVPTGGGGGGGGYYGGGGGGTNNPNLNPQSDCSNGAGGGGSSYINIPAARNPVIIENSQGTSGKIPQFYRNFYTIRW